MLLAPGHKRRHTFPLLSLLILPPPRSLDRTPIQPRPPSPVSSTLYYLLIYFTTEHATVMISCPDLASCIVDLLIRPLTFFCGIVLSLVPERRIRSTFT
ncbi:hypothetical protein BD414DRAFT_475931 [Trametes punicea]|nr:hypothetical protein BD414DRAFT_475931 [Trametes punicea]